MAQGDNLNYTGTEHGKIRTSLFMFLFIDMVQEMAIRQVDRKRLLKKMQGVPNLKFVKILKSACQNFQILQGRTKDRGA